jgi:hypothetical protein
MRLICTVFQISTALESRLSQLDLGVGQADRLTIAHRAHRPEVAGDIAAQRAGAARPSAQAAQSIQAPVDRGGTSPGGDHVLAVGD